MPSKADSRPKPRLYLATPPLTAAGAFASQLAAAIKGVDVAAVLLRVASIDDTAAVALIDALAPIVQKEGAALLVDGRAEAAQRSTADGVHIAEPAALKDAVERLRPERIVGAGGLHSRHEAMIAGEAGADYVLFGEPDAAGERPSKEAIVERVGWWAELFEPPCVAYAATLAEAREFAAAGADFIMADALAWNDARGAHAALMDASAAIGQN